MPVRRRVEKRRLSPMGEMEAWSVAFGSGYDFFGELAGIGGTVDEYGRPDLAEAESAWRRLGDLYLQTLDASPVTMIWADDEFPGLHPREARPPTLTRPAPR